MVPLILPALAYASKPEQAQEETRNMLILEKTTGRAHQLPMPSLSVTSPLSDHTPTPRGPIFTTTSPEIPSPASATSEETANSSGKNTESTFDELYDISDDEYESRHGVVVPLARSPSVRSEEGSFGDPSRDSYTSELSEEASSPRRNRYPSLVIPSPAAWPQVPTFKTLIKNSPVPPTPPPKLPLSPAVLSMLLNDAVSPASDAPSLDESLSSDQIANNSAPPTPLLRPAEEGEHWDGQIRLNPDALATLQCLGVDEHLEEEDQAMEIAAPEPVNQEMVEVSAPLLRPPSMPVLSPTTQLSFEGLTRLDIPSPGAFFSSLGSAARHTWGPMSAMPPSSATAEHFYMAPWNASNDNTVRRIIELPDNGSDGPPTARPNVISSPPTDSALEVDEIERRTHPVVYEYDENYPQELQKTAVSNLDRTSLWLAAQTSYLSALRETNPMNDPSSQINPVTPSVDTGSPQLSNRSSPSKKTVRFLDVDPVPPTPAPTSPLPSTPATPLFYQAFQHLARIAHPTDALVHSAIRLSALRGTLLCLPMTYYHQVSSSYVLPAPRTPVSSRPISFAPAGAPKMVEQTEQQIMISRVEQERSALQQISPASWALAVTRMLNGGKLLMSPASKHLARLSMATCARPTQMTGSIRGNRRARVLEVGAQDPLWGWSVARDFPGVKVWSTFITSKMYNRKGDGLKLSGPPNHRRIGVENVWHLPFPDNYFDVISARSLHELLRTWKIPQPSSASTTFSTENGLEDDTPDEYTAVLKELYRVLRPGGYLEFSVLDADIINAGPLGAAFSVESVFKLKAHGYDPNASRTFLERLSHAGFEKIKRAWLVLPMSTAASEACVSSTRLAVSKYDGPVCEKDRTVIVTHADDGSMIMRPDTAMSSSSTLTVNSAASSSSTAPLTAAAQRVPPGIRQTGRAYSLFPSTTPAPRAGTPSSTISGSTAATLRPTQTTPTPADKTAAVEEELSGSSTNIGALTGLLGTWMWSRWMVRLGMESRVQAGIPQQKSEEDEEGKADPEEVFLMAVLAEMGRVLEEGRKWNGETTGGNMEEDGKAEGKGSGSWDTVGVPGWKVLNGWCKKEVPGH